MRRQVIFRGKRLDNGEWVYGDLMQAYSGERHIAFWFDKLVEPEVNLWEPTHDMVEVDPDTVGQFTGMLDKNGTKIFEGDNIIHTSFPRQIAIVIFVDGVFVAKYNDNDMPVKSYHSSVIEVIGNIHDNTELPCDRT